MEEYTIEMSGSKSGVESNPHGVMFNSSRDMYASDINDIVKNTSEGFKAVIYEEIKTPNGKPLFQRIATNNTLIGGRQLNAMLVSGIQNGAIGNIKIRTFDEEVGINLSADTVDAGLPDAIFGCLFSIDGASLGTVYPVKKSSRGFSKDGIIPMRMVPIAEDDGSLFAKYEMRSVEDGYAKYYIKRPVSITLVNLTADGDTLSDYPDTSLLDDVDVYSMVQMKIVFEEDDMREYFAYVEGDVSSRRFNAFSILRGTPVTTSYNGNTGVEHRNVICTQRANGKDRNLEKYGTGTYIINIYYK